MCIYVCVCAYEQERVLQLFFPFDAMTSILLKDVLFTDTFPVHKLVRKYLTGTIIMAHLSKGGP